MLATTLYQALNASNVIPLVKLAMDQHLLIVLHVQAQRSSSPQVNHVFTLMLPQRMQHRSLVLRQKLCLFLRLYQQS